MNRAQSNRASNIDSRTYLFIAARLRILAVFLKKGFYVDQSGCTSRAESWCAGSLANRAAQAPWPSAQCLFNPRTRSRQGDALSCVNFTRAEPVCPNSVAIFRNCPIALFGIAIAVIVAWLVIRRHVGMEFVRSFRTHGPCQNRAIKTAIHKCESLVLKMVNFGGISMKRTFSLLLLATLSIPFFGCGETTEYQKKTTVETPGGSTTTTDTKKVEKSGENPPPTPP